MGRLIKVFETGSGKWVLVDGDKIIYTSDPSACSIFSLGELIAANQYFEDFSIYQRTLKAIPLGSNVAPTDCNSVKAYIAKQKTGE
jgi:hypothetical protein